jgi:hypothetical protein
MKTLKRRSSYSMIPSNGQVEPLLPTLQPQSTPMTVLPSSDKAWKKNHNSARDGNKQGHLKTRGYSTELYGTSNNFSTGTEMIASKASYKA